MLVRTNVYTGVFGSRLLRVGMDVVELGLQ